MNTGIVRKIDDLGRVVIPAEAAGASRIIVPNCPSPKVVKRYHFCPSPVRMV